MVQQLYRDSMDLALRSAAWGIELLARGVGAAARMLPDTGKDVGSRKRPSKDTGSPFSAATRGDR